ncbi:TPA: hypothetical protein N0F65_012757 [Lagenidium giganteum]|uniref:Uncharacterized protein n=1 Tax=Lagenidium giganteum TaxID=4803 RepID=A0AAV2YA89_9STRA|nr:TPA: hypothetical protein N0F65_012757 [Lagenidium giganteum]
MDLRVGAITGIAEESAATARGDEPSPRHSHTSATLVEAIPVNSADQGRGSITDVPKPTVVVSPATSSPSDTTSPKVRKDEEWQPENTRRIEDSGQAAAAAHRHHTLTRSGSQRAMSRRNLRAGSTPTVPTPSQEAAEQEEEELTFIMPEINKDGGELTNNQTVKETWPVDHVMLLYMLSRYAVCARTAHEKETWIREIPLLVLMYEGIAAGVLNFDYAPASMLIAQEGRPKRIWMNTTQDGKSAVDDLREANLINGLKLSTRDYHSVTAFQVSLRGLELLAQVGKEHQNKVDSFIFAPKPYRRELLKIRYIPIKDEPESELLSMNDPSSGSWSNSAKQLVRQEDPSSLVNEQGRFILESIGYFRYSEVSETEDVSYVSSPFVPQCVRGIEAYQQLSSNAHRAQEAAGGQSNIRDTLSEAITLANPVCLVGEWIPFGSNQIVALNERLGSMDRCQGGLFTSLIDDRPTDTQFEVPPGLTEVRILDYDPVRFINFEAEINFPEEDGIVQVENLGIHLNVDGTIFYGIRVDAILDKRSDRISVDLLSRLLVDIHQDSSEIMDDLLSSYQSSLLEMVFLGDVANRAKFNMIMADHIEPFMPGLEYMDRGDYENELKQVLGDIHCAYDIGEDSVMIVGRDGMLIAGSAGKRFEKVFISYFSLLCREIFLRSFFTRIFVLEERLKHIRKLIFQAKENPSHITDIRSLLNNATNDLILFTDTLGYLLESLEFVKIPHKSPNATEEEEAIYGYLDLKKQHHDILTRARDLEKLVHGSKYELVNLRQMAEVLNTTQLEDIFKTVESNTKVLADSTSVTRKSGVALEMVHLLLAGSFAFTLLDRVPGGTLNAKAPTWVLEAFSMIIDTPFLFFVLNVLWMLAFVLGLWWIKRREHERNENGERTLHVKVNKAIDVEAFESFLATRVLEKQESFSQVAAELRHVMWTEMSGSSCSGADTHQSNRNRNRKESLQRASEAARGGGGGLLRSLLPRWLGEDNASTAHKPTAVIVPNIRPPSASKNKAVMDHKIQVEVEYDSRHGFLLYVTFHVHLRTIQHLLDQYAENTWVRRALRFMKKAVGYDVQSASRHSVSSTGSAHLSPPRKSKANVGQDEASKSNDMVQVESQLLRWFATELQEHRVIASVEHLIG